MALRFPIVAAALALVAPLWAQDVDAFWRTTRERLAAEPMEAYVEPVAEALPYKKYQVTLRSCLDFYARSWMWLERNFLHRTAAHMPNR